MIVSESTMERAQFLYWIHFNVFGKWYVQVANTTMVPLTNIKIDEWHDITEQCLQILIEKNYISTQVWHTFCVYVSPDNSFDWS